LPLCSRCTGIYAGFLVSFVFAWIMHGRKKFLRFDKKVYALSSILLLAFFLDSLLSYAGLYIAANPARLLLGLLGGMPLGIFSFALLNDSLSEKRYFIKTQFSLKDFSLLAFIMLGLFSLIAFSQFRFVFCLWTILGAGGLLFTYAAVNLTVVSLFLAGQKNRKKFRLKLAVYTILLIAAETLLLAFI
ncbi:MAG: DUF2085 domain-containing protein, partial [Candidatus Omnitrophica bacterium]|nr:DUF2085 domain-containing protein [Candidatus Omnitrophota bacterium]